MKLYKNLLLLVVIFFLSVLSGCSFFSAKEAGYQPATVVDFTDKKLVNKAVLSAGGKLLVLPFRAGEGVPSNEELDKVSLVVIRGIVDSFNASKGHSKLEIIFSDDRNEADFVLMGYITKMSSPSRLAKWVLRKKQSILAAEGKILQRKSSIPVVTFKEKVKMKDKAFSELGLELGQKVGHFIVNH